MSTEGIPRVLLPDIESLRRSWMRARLFWSVVHYVLGTVATVTSISVAARPAFLVSLPPTLEILAYLSAVCIALLTFLVPARMGRGDIRAWRVLTVACNLYKHDPGFELAKLLKAVKEGEEYIARESDT